MTVLRPVGWRRQQQAGSGDAARLLAPHGDCGGEHDPADAEARSCGLAGAHEVRSCKLRPAGAAARATRAVERALERTLPARRAVERAGLVEPAVERPRPPLVGEDRVLDRLAHAALDVGAGAHALHQLERLVAVFLLG